MIVRVPPAGGTNSCMRAAGAQIAGRVDGDLHPSRAARAWSGFSLLAGVAVAQTNARRTDDDGGATTISSRRTRPVDPPRPAASLHRVAPSVGSRSAMRSPSCSPDATAVSSRPRRSTLTGRAVRASAVHDVRDRGAIDLKDRRRRHDDDVVEAIQLDARRRAHAGSQPRVALHPAR